MAVFANLSRMLDFGNIKDVTFSGTSTRVGPFNDYDEVILDCTVRCYVNVGDVTVTAVAGNGNLSVNPTGKSIIRVPRGCYIAVIQAPGGGGSGTLNIAPVLK
jgi:hypothetical protein